MQNPNPNPTDPELADLEQKKAAADAAYRARFNQPNAQRDSQGNPVSDKGAVAQASAEQAVADKAAAEQARADRVAEIKVRARISGAGQVLTNEEAAELANADHLPVIKVLGKSADDTATVQALVVKASASQERANQTPASNVLAEQARADQVELEQARATWAKSRPRGTCGAVNEHYNSFKAGEVMVCELEKGHEGNHQAHYLRGEGAVNSIAAWNDAATVPTPLE